MRQQHPEGTSYFMTVRHVDPIPGRHNTEHWEEPIPKHTLQNQSIGHFPPETRAQMVIDFWNETLRKHECRRELVKVERIEIKRTEIPFS